MKKGRRENKARVKETTVQNKCLSGLSFQLLTITNHTSGNQYVSCMAISLAVSAR